MILIRILWFPLLFHSVLSSRNCCSTETAFLGYKGCSDGGPISFDYNCSAKYGIYKGDENYTVTVDGHLLEENTKIPPDLYCLGKTSDGIEIAVVCMLDDFRPNKFNWTTICGIISIIFITFTIIVYYLVPCLRDLQGKCIMHFLHGLGLAYTSLAIIQQNVYTYSMCTFMAFVMYFTFLLAFFWLNVVAFNLWRTIVIPNMFKKTEERWHLIYGIYGYGAPLCCLIGTIIAHNVEGDHMKPGFGQTKCFFGGVMETWAYFYCPIAILLVINVTLFIFSSSRIWFKRNLSDSTKLPKMKYRFLLTLKLFLIMGVLWIFEILSFAGENVHKYLNYLWMITDIINTLQGVLIFFILVLFRKKALRGIANNSFIGSKFPHSWRTLKDEECTEEDEETKEVSIDA